MDENYPEQVYHVSDGTANVQDTLMVKLPIPIVRQTGQLDWQDLHFDNVSPQGRNMCRTQQTIWGHANMSQRVYLKDNQFQLPTRNSVGNKNPYESDGIHSSQMPQTTHWEEMMEIEIGVQVILWVMVDIPIDLVSVVVPMAPQVVMMVEPLINLMEVIQIVPHLLNLDDSVGMTDILNNMINNEQNLTAMNNLLNDLLQCQQRSQDNTTYTLQVINQLKETIQMTL